jgi:SAM-dependent methyltransferase
VQLVEGDMTRLTVDAQSADLCLSYGGLHCVPEPSKALSEMARCLRPGGRLLGSTFLTHGSRRQRILLRNEDFGITGSAAEAAVASARATRRDRSGGSPSWRLPSRARTGTPSPRSATRAALTRTGRIPGPCESRMGRTEPAASS